MKIDAEVQIWWYAGKPVCGFEAVPSALGLQTGWDFPDVQAPADPSLCLQLWAVPAPVDLSALICCQNVACIVLCTVQYNTNSTNNAFM